MSLSKFLPTPAAVSRETLAVLAATVIAAFIISRIPALQALVRDNSIPSPLGS